ncbi:hypothetical protein QA612_09565 [Evansella sp. AB-P1]|nr:hypothetical protein [Evansella sp. AB-P1]MDG5787746.1 hypothetical protein [Evansella sp. AB-P1]
MQVDIAPWGDENVLSKVYYLPTFLLFSICGEHWRSSIFPQTFFFRFAGL